MWRRDPSTERNRMGTVVSRFAGKSPTHPWYHAPIRLHSRFAVAADEPGSIQEQPCRWAYMADLRPFDR